MPANTRTTTQTPSRAASLEDFLVQQKFLNADMIARARAESQTSHRNLFDYLLGEKLISEEDLTRARGLFF